METFSALLVLGEGNSPVTGEFPSQRPMTQSFDVFFHLRLNKWFSKESRRRLFETPSRYDVTEMNLPVSPEGLSLHIFFVSEFGHDASYKKRTI